MALQRHILSSALPNILAAQELTRSSRRDIERFEVATAEGADNPEAALKEAESEEHARYNLASHLTTYFHTLALAMEACDLAEGSRALRLAWGTPSMQELGHTTYSRPHEYSESTHLNLLDAALDGLRPLADDRLINAELVRLESILRSTATIVRDEKVTPRREHDVQAVMHKYLRVYYPTFTTNITIPGSLQNYKPDSGIADLGAAIEFKFVDKEAEARGAIRGIIEDTAGYSGSRDWNQFFAVIYQTEPFVPEHRYAEDLRRVGASTWSVLVVTGAGGRAAKAGAAALPATGAPAPVQVAAPAPDPAPQGA